MTKGTHLANVVTAQLNLAISTLGAFVVTPVILNGLGDSAYGGWLLLNSFIVYLRFLDLGNTAGTVKYGAGALGRGDAAEVRATLNTSAAIFTTCGIVTALATLAIARVLPTMYPSFASNHTNAILALGGAMALEMLFRPFVAAIRIRLLYWVYDLAEIITYLIFKFGLVFYFAQTRGLTYELLAYLTLCETLVRLGAMGVAAAFALPAVRRLNPFGVSRAMIHKIGGMGVAVTIIMVADIVRFQLDAGVIGYFMPDKPESIAIYGIGARVANMAAGMIGVIAGVLFPRFAALAEVGDHDATYDLQKRTSYYTGLACAYILVNLVVLGPQFLTIWLHKPWTGRSATILLIFIPGYWLGLLAGGSTSALAGAGRLKRLAMFVVVEAAVNFAVSIILVKPLGIVGVALGTAIPLTAFQIFVLPVLIQRETGMRVADYWRMHARGLQIGGIYLVLIAVLALNPTSEITRFLMKATLSTCVFAGLVLVMEPTARLAVVNGLARWRRAGTAEA
ncbi:MAG: polysaccharide biosynthesis C-terminal domain-containing protein [Vicinamibacterales bacterium]